jgi:hypothetical protein
VSSSGLIAVGLMALLYVGVSEYLGVQEAEAWQSWEAAIAEHDRLQDESKRVLDEFFSREELSAQDIVDAYRIAELNERAASALDSASRVPDGVGPHRAKVAGLEREFASAFRAFAEAAGRESEADVQRHLERAEALDAEIGSAIDAYNAWVDEQDRPEAE